MPRGVGVRVPLSARMFEASDFSSRSSFFFCFGQMQALAPATKKTWSATPRLNMCNKEYGLWGCGDKKILDFQRHPRFTSLREAAESFIRTSKIEQSVLTALFFCADTPQLCLHSLQPPFEKGRL